jgi:cytochrome P450
MPAVQDATADTLVFQLMLTPEGRRDPYPLYRQLREAAPVLRSGFGPLVLSRYDDCVSALRDPRLGRGTSLRAEGDSGPVGFGALDADPARRQRFFEQAGNNMLFADPPDHTRLRRLVSRAFTPKRIEALRPAVQRMVDEVLDHMAGAGAVDVMEVLAFPLPVAVIGELVGVPASVRPSFQPLVRAGTAALDPAAPAEVLEDATAAMERMRAYFAELVAERRSESTDDLLSGLVAARDAGDALNDDEVIATAILLFAAGFETTTNLIGNGLLALLQQPEEMRRWREHPALAPLAVEELLRWDSPVQVNMRTALEPAELAGEHLDPGDVVIVLQGGANRDPARFDRPEELDLSRPGNAPLSFGMGIHHCLGAGLARMEGELVFNSLLARFAAIALASEEVEWRPNLTLRGLASLPVELVPA